MFLFGYHDYTFFLHDLNLVRFMEVLKVLKVNDVCFVAEVTAAIVVLMSILLGVNFVKMSLYILFLLCLFQWAIRHTVLDDLKFLFLQRYVNYTYIVMLNLCTCKLQKYGCMVFKERINVLYYYYERKTGRIHDSFNFYHVLCS